MEPNTNQIIRARTRATSDTRMYGEVTHSTRVFFALNVFFMTSLFSFALSTGSMIPFPSYTPSLVPEGVSPDLLGISLYAQLAFSLVLGTLTSLIFYALVPQIHHAIEIRLKTFKNFTTFGLLFALSSSIVVIFQRWLPQQDAFFGPHLWIFLIALAVFLSLFVLVLIVEKKIYE